MLVIQGSCQVGRALSLGWMVVICKNKIFEAKVSHHHVTQHLFLQYSFLMALGNNSLAAENSAHKLNGVFNFFPEEKFSDNIAIMFLL